MPKKSARVVLTLLGSAAWGAGCSQAPLPTPPPADTFTSQIDFEQEPGEQPVDANGQTSVAPTAGQTAQSHTTGHSSHYHHRGSSLWPLLFWGATSRGATAYQQAAPATVPRGPSHVMPPPIPAHSGHSTGTHPTASHFPTAAGHATHAATSHPSTTHTSGTRTGSTAHVSSHGFGSTGHAVSGGS